MFWFIYVGLASISTLLVFIILVFCLFWNHITHLIISKLMHHFYLHHPSSHKQFDTWDVDHLLSLLASWFLSSSPFTFKHAWKRATLLALLLQNIVLVYLGYILIICTFFCSTILLFLFWHLLVSEINWVIYHLRYALNLILMLILGLFYLGRITYTVLSLLGRSQIGLVFTPLFLGNNR